MRALHAFTEMMPRCGSPTRFALLLSLAMTACDDGGGPTELRAPPVFGEVAGVVTVEGAPIAGIGVDLSGEVIRSSITDIAGAYRFEELPEGSYVVALTRLPEDLALSADRMSLVVREGAQTARADFAGSWRRDASIMVSIAVEGVGLEGLGVTLAGPEERSAETDESGAVSFGGLLAGSYGIAMAGFDPLLVEFAVVEQSVQVENDAVAEVHFEGTVRIPSAPTHLGALAMGSSKVRVFWVDASDNEATFEIWRTEGPDGTGVQVGSIAANATGFTDSELSPATSYRYRIRACNASGCSDESEEVSVTTNDVSPAVPTDLEALVAGPYAVDLTWTDISDNEGGFELERAGGTERGWQALAELPAGSAGFSDSGLLEGTRYSYRVRACNDAGCSENSNVASAVTPGVPPQTPAGLEATATGPHVIDLGWGDTSGDENGFEVVRKDGGSGAEWSVVRVVGANVVGVSDTGLQPSTTYTYRVRACNDAGCSEYSGEASATTDDVPPEAPFNLSATAAGTSSIHLTWLDGADNETSLDVERRQGLVWIDAASLAANATQFTDIGLAPATAYVYHVRACNSEGCSPWSGEASATTDAVPSGPNLTISALYITQRTQRLSGDVPLIADLGGYLRVFATANGANALQPTVDVEFYQGGSLVHTETLVAGSPGVPTAVDESNFSTSWNVTVPASLIQPGFAIRAVVDPLNVVGESNETDNEYPPGGAPLLMDVRDPSPFRVTLIPVRHSVNGTVGGVNAGNQDSFMAEVRKLFPVASDDVVLHAEYATTAPELQSSDGNGAWGTILSEINALRLMEGGSRYYYGVVHPTYGGGIAGLGYVGWPAAIGWDKLPSGAGVAAHEWGHNLGRRHSPGCGAGNPDPSYPYPGGVIGVWGYDLTTQTHRSPSGYYDLMSYCGPEWISDYVYEAILQFRETSPVVAAPPAPGAGLLVWGRVEGGATVLEPAFQVEAPVALPSEGGAFVLEGRGAADELLFSFPFGPTPVADGVEDEGHFAFVVPLALLSGQELSELRVTRDGLPVASRRSVPNGLAVPAAPTADLAAPGDGTAEVRWNVGAHPMVLVRDATTGQVLSFARGGTARVRPASDRIELVFSDGVSSSAPQIRDWR